MTSEKIDGLMTVENIMEEYGIGKSTAWTWLRRAQIERFTVPGHGKTVFVRRADLSSFTSTGYALSSREEVRS
jgi:hypothetical protein